MNSVFNFQFERVMQHCDTIESVQEQILYLEYVVKEYANIKLGYSDEIFIAYYGDDNEKIKNEIEYKKKLLAAQPKEKINGESQNNQKKINVEIEKIKWQGTDAQMTYLFELLFKEKFLLGTDNFQKHKLVVNHFVNKDGKPFSPPNLASTLQNYKGNKHGKPNEKSDGKPIGYEKLEQIVSATKELPTKTPKKKMKMFVYPKEK